MSRAPWDVFPDADGAISSSFFHSTDVCEKTWHDVGFLAESDNRTFWTTIANHTDLPLVLRNLVGAVDNAHSSALPAMRHVVKRKDELALAAILVRLVTTNGVALRAGVDIIELAKRIGVLIPPTLLMPVSLLLLRLNGHIAAVTLTSLLLLYPAHLCAMKGLAASWCDTTARLGVRCVRDLPRGRHQRLAGDVLPLFEQTYRHVKHLWALLHTAPFLADYLNLSRVLESLRVVVDLLSPVLQHFMLTCTALAKHREQLSKANSVIVNAAVNTATVLVLFRTYDNASTHSRSHCVERPVNSAYEALVGYIQQKVDAPPAQLLSNPKRSLTMLVHALVDPPVDTVSDRQVGKVLRGLLEPIPESADFAGGFIGSRPRYFDLLLLELVQQGFHIDVLLAKKFVTTSEAEELGASEQTILRAIAGIVDECTTVANITHDADPPAAVSVAPVSDDPAVNIVLDVMPHFNINGIKAALSYYNGDVQQFILDASIENIPPHIISQLTEPPPAPQVLTPPSLSHQSTAVSRAAPPPPPPPAAHVTSADYDDEELGEVDLNLLIGDDLYETINTAKWSDEGGAAAFGTIPCDAMYSTLHRDDDEGDRGGAEMFAVDEGMKEKIRMLTELMYEDEFDDAQELPEVHRYARDSDSDSSLSDNTPIPPDDASADLPSGSVNAAPARRPRTQYDDKRFHDARAKQREKTVKEKKEARASEPSYTRKKKTMRKTQGHENAKGSPGQIQSHIRNNFQLVFLVLGDYGNGCNESAAGLYSGDWCGRAALRPSLHAEPLPMRRGQRGRSPRPTRSAVGLTSPSQSAAVEGICYSDVDNQVEEQEVYHRLTEATTRLADYAFCRRLVVVWSTATSVFGSLKEGTPNIGVPLSETKQLLLTRLLERAPSHDLVLRDLDQSYSCSVLLGPNACRSLTLHCPEVLSVLASRLSPDVFFHEIVEKRLMCSETLLSKCMQEVVRGALEKGELYEAAESFWMRQAHLELALLSESQENCDTENDCEAVLENYLSQIVSTHERVRFLSNLLRGVDRRRCTLFTERICSRTRNQDTLFLLIKVMSTWIKEYHCPGDAAVLLYHITQTKVIDLSTHSSAAIEQEAVASFRDSVAQLGFLFPEQVVDKVGEGESVIQWLKMLSEVPPKFFDEPTLVVWCFWTMRALVQWEEKHDNSTLNNEAITVNVLRAVRNLCLALENCKADAVLPPMLLNWLASRTCMSWAEATGWIARNAGVEASQRRRFLFIRLPLGRAALETFADPQKGKQTLLAVKSELGKNALYVYNHYHLSTHHRQQNMNRGGDVQDDFKELYKAIRVNLLRAWYNHATSLPHLPDNTVPCTLNALSLARKRSRASLRMSRGEFIVFSLQEALKKLVERGVTPTLW